VPSLHLNGSEGIEGLTNEIIQNNANSNFGNETTNATVDRDPLPAQNTLTSPPTIVEVPLDKPGMDFSSSLFDSSVIAAEINESDYVLYIGESTTVPIPEGSNPFVSDDELLTLDIPPSGTSLKITALRGGKAELLYFENGQLRSLVIVVLFPETFDINIFGPKFIPGLMYFIYTFSNSIRFTEKDYYQNSVYLHGLRTHAPLGDGIYTQDIVFEHRDLDDWKFREALAAYRDPHLIVKLGNNFLNLNLLSDSALVNKPIFGASASFINFLLGQDDDNKYYEQFSFFGGVETPSDIFQLSADGQVYGFNYSIQESFQNTLFPDLLNTTFLLYQPLGSSAFHYAGWIEGNYHFSPSLSLGAGGYVGHGGFAFLLIPFYEDDAGTLSLEYRFIDSGLEQISGGIFDDTLHRLDADLQRYLDADQRHILDLSTVYSLSIPPGAGVQSTNFISFNSSYTHRQAFRNYFNISYAFSRSNILQNIFLLNSLGGTYGYSLGPQSFLVHSLSYSRQDFTNPTQRVIGATSFSVENASHRFLTSAQAAWEKSNLLGTQLSLLVILRNDFALRKGQFSFELSYEKERFDDNIHEIRLDPILDYFVTSVIRLTVSSSVILSFGNPELLNGSVFAQLQIFFGPGIEPGEPLFESIFGGGKGYQLDGRVFLDQNYNALYDDTIDSPILRAAVLLNNSSRSITDEDGMYTFLKVLKESLYYQANQIDQFRQQLCHNRHLERCFLRIKPRFFGFFRFHW